MMYTANDVRLFFEGKEIAQMESLDLDKPILLNTKVEIYESEEVK